MDLRQYCKDKDGDFIEVSELLELLKDKFNLLKDSNRLNIETLVKKLKENNIEVVKIRDLVNKRRYSNNIRKSDVLTVFDIILGGIVVENNKGEGFSEPQTKFNIERVNKLIAINDFEKVLGEEILTYISCSKIANEVPRVKVPFFNKGDVYYDKDSIEKFIECYKKENLLVKMTIENNKEVWESIDGKKLVLISDFIDELKSKLPTIMAKTQYEGGVFFRKFEHLYSGKVYRVGSSGLGTIAIPEDEVEQFMENIAKEVEITNVEEKDDIGQDCVVKYNITKEQLSLDFIKKHFVDKEYVYKTIGTNVSFKSLNRRIQSLRTSLDARFVFYRKETVDLIKNIQDTCVTLEEIRLIIKKDLKKDFSADIIRKIINDNNFTIYESVPGVGGSISSTQKSIPKEYISKIKEILRERMLYDDCEDVYSCMEKYIQNKAESKNNKIKETLKYYDKHLINVNNATNLKYTSRIFNIESQTYDLLNKELEKEITLYNDEEKIKLFDKIALNYSNHIFENFRNFFNFVMDEKRETNRKVYRPERESKKVEPYELQAYFSVLGNLINFIDDKEKVLKYLTPEVVGGRPSATALLYVLTHYTACWRATDIFEKLPKPNLRLIGFNSGEEFLEWFKKEDSVFTEEMGKIICDDLEEKIINTRACASKNDGKLLIYVSKFLHRIYGLLVCICEVCRQYAKKENLISNNSSSRIAEVINKVDVEILKPTGGTFKNRNANKSFETYVCEKSEEWNMGIGYMMAAVARGHKLKKYHYSETTKIYIDKDVDKMSFMVFSANVFSGIKYEFLNLIDENFENKTLEEKSIQATEFGMSNYEVEIMLQSVAKKQFVIDRFFREKLTNKNMKRKTLQELIFGKDCSSKHEDAKCLYRAYESAKNSDMVDITKGFIKECAYKNVKSCVGCPYIVAEKYFLYELQSKLTEALAALQNAKSEFDKKIHINRINELFFPMIREAMLEFGKEYVRNIVDVEKMTLIYKEEKKKLESV